MEAEPLLLPDTPPNQQPLDIPFPKPDFTEVLQDPITECSLEKAEAPILKPTFKNILQAKKRLQAFSSTRPGSLPSSPKKVKPTSGPEEKTEESLSPTKKTPKKGATHDDKAKAVIEEIEELKREELAHLVSHRQSLKRSRSRSKSQDKGRFKKVDKKSRNYRRRSLTPEKPKKSPKKAKKYPRNWREFYEFQLDFDLNRNFEVAAPVGNNEMLRQVLFESPSLPIVTFKMKTANREEKVVPFGYVRYTRTKPVVPYSVNFGAIKDSVITKKMIWDSLPKEAAANIERLYSNCFKFKNCESDGKMKKPSCWYPKIWRDPENECKILEKSVGLSFLQSYTGEEEETDFVEEETKVEEKAEPEKTTVEDSMILEEVKDEPDDVKKKKKKQKKDQDQETAEKKKKKRPHKDKKKHTDDNTTEATTKKKKRKKDKTKKKEKRSKEKKHKHKKSKEKKKKDRAEDEPVEKPEEAKTVDEKPPKKKEEEKKPEKDEKTDKEEKTRKRKHSEHEDTSKKHKQHKRPSDENTEKIEHALKKKLEKAKKFEMESKIEDHRRKKEDVKKAKTPEDDRKGEPKHRKKSRWSEPGSVKEEIVSFEDLKVIEEILQIKQEDEKVSEEPKQSTPDTDEYHSHWESEDDVATAVPRPTLMLKPNRSWESDEELFERSHNRQSTQSESYANLEIPLNIKNFSRRSNWDEKPLSVIDELKLLEEERRSLSEERRKLELEKQQIKRLQEEALLQKPEEPPKEAVRPRSSTPEEAVVKVKKEKTDLNDFSIDSLNNSLLSNVSSTESNFPIAALENEYEEFIKAVSSDVSPKKKVERRSSTSSSWSTDSEQKKKKRKKKKKKKKKARDCEGLLLGKGNIFNEFDIPVPSDLPEMVPTPVPVPSPLLPLDTMLPPTLLLNSIIEKPVAEDPPIPETGLDLTKPFVFSSIVLSTKKIPLVDNSNLKLDDSDSADFTDKFVKKLEDVVADPPPPEENVEPLQVETAPPVEEEPIKTEAAPEIAPAPIESIEDVPLPPTDPPLVVETKPVEPHKPPPPPPEEKKRSRSRSRDHERRRRSPPRRATPPSRRRYSSPRRRRSPTPPRRRSPTPLRRRSPSPLRRRSPASPRRRSLSPFRRRSLSPLRRRSPTPPRRRSPFRRRSPSPRRRRRRSPSLSPPRSRGGARKRTPSPRIRRASPLNSPLDGFKRSVADSTISDDMLPQPNPDEYSQSPPPSQGGAKYYDKKSTRKMSLSPPPMSPKRIPLDDRINLVLGLEKPEPPPPLPPPKLVESYPNYNYGNVNSYGQYPQYNQFAQKNDFAPPAFGPVMYTQPPPPIPKPVMTPSKVVQVGNILQVVPNEEIPPPPPPMVEKTPERSQQIVQVGNMLQIVPAVMHSIKPPPPPELQPVAKPVPSPEKQSAETIMKQKIAERKAEREKRRLERERRRKEKEKKRKDKEKRRQMKLKIKTENMIKRAIQLETEALANEGAETEGEQKESPVQWPPVPVIISTTPSGKGILLSQGGSRKRKSVQFADGVRPGEGTSPSGGEELSSPPPCKLPKEKRYKKVKIPKKSKKKKVRVKVIKKVPEEPLDDDDDDNLPPPSPPPGSPPPHVFPSRVKTHTINNVQHYVGNIIQTNHTAFPFRPPMPVVINRHQPPPGYMPPGAYPSDVNSLGHQPYQGVTSHH